MQKRLNKTKNLNQAQPVSWASFSRFDQSWGVNIRISSSLLFLTLVFCFKALRLDRPLPGNTLHIKNHTRYMSRLCSRDGKICCYGDALSTFFLLLVPCFLLFVFLFFSYLFSLHPGMFIFVSLRLCSSHLLLSASTYFIVRLLSACVICTLPHLGILLFLVRSVFFS